MFYPIDYLSIEKKLKSIYDETKKLGRYEPEEPKPPNENTENNDILYTTLTSTLKSIDIKLNDLIDILSVQTLDPKYWKRVIRLTETPIVITKNSEYTFDQSNDCLGMYEYLLIRTDNPNLKITIKLENIKHEFTINDLYDFGYIGPNNRTAWISKFDSDNNDYVVNFTPVPYPIFRNMEIKLSCNDIASKVFGVSIIFKRIF